jgi:3-deoxy-manno-octulosonate cytidylyltransferase (CMP-KDO synthetase)
MVWHVVQRCIEGGFNKENIVVATDSVEIQNKLHKYNIKTVMTSSEHISGTDRVYEVASKLAWPLSDTVINVQGDEPLIPAQLIRELASFTKKINNFDITTAVVPISSGEDLDNPNVVKAVLGENSRAVYFTRSATPINRDDPGDMSLAYRHVGIYAYSVKSLGVFCSLESSSIEKYEKLEQLRAISNGLSIGAIMFTDHVPHGVDTQDDYNKIKNIIEGE